MLRIIKIIPRVSDVQEPRSWKGGSNLVYRFGFLQEVHIPDICTRVVLSPLSMYSEDIFKTITKPADEVNSSQVWD